MRALEGEIARTIQVLKGVKAARVHIVMPARGSFRREQSPPSASVVLRTDGPADARTARSVRHLVAAAVPGMTRGQGHRARQRRHRCSRTMTAAAASGQRRPRWPICRRSSAARSRRM